MVPPKWVEFEGRRVIKSPQYLIIACIICIVLAQFGQHFTKNIGFVLKKNKFDKYGVLTKKRIFFSAPRVLQVLNMIKLYSDMPYTLLIGAGPGTLLSRAYCMGATSKRRVGFKKPDAAQRIIRKYLLLGDPMDISLAKIYAPVGRYEKGWSLRGGSTITETPYCTIYALLMETGVISYILMMLIYLIPLTKMWKMGKEFVLVGDGIGAAASYAAIFGLIHLLFLTFVDNIFENQFFTIPVWYLVGIAFLRYKLLLQKSSDFS